MKRLMQPIPTELPEELCIPASKELLVDYYLEIEWVKKRAIVALKNDVVDTGNNLLLDTWT